jgi:hypothetical protein
MILQISYCSCDEEDHRKVTAYDLKIAPVYYKSYLPKRCTISIYQVTADVGK